MSNRPKTTGKPYSIDRYRAEAKGEPFVIWLDEDKSIEIARPTGDQMFAAETAQNVGTSRDVLVAICGDKAEEFLAALGPEDAAVLMAVTKDMQEHFGMGN